MTRGPPILGKNGESIPERELVRSKKAPGNYPDIIAKTERTETLRNQTAEGAFFAERIKLGGGGKLELVTEGETGRSLKEESEIWLEGFKEKAVPAIPLVSSGGTSFNKWAHRKSSAKNRPGDHEGLHNEIDKKRLYTSSRLCET